MKSRTYLLSNHKLLAAASLVGLTFVANGCGDDSKKLEEKTITVGEFSLLDKKIFNHHLATNNLTVSGDGKNVYLTVNASHELYHNDGSNLETGWSKIELAPPGFDDTVGKAKLESANTISQISAGIDGVMVSVNGTTPTVPPVVDSSPDNGVFHIKGKTHTAAWATSAQDVNATAAGAPGAAGRFFTSTRIMGVLVSKDKADIPLFFGDDSGNPGDWVAVTKADLTAAIADLSVKRATTPFAAQPKLVSGGEYLFAVDNLGVTAMAKADIGTAKDFPVVAVGTAAATTGEVGSEAFRMKTGVNNNTVSAVAVSGNNLYIGFTAGADFEGGVAVYEIKPAGEAPVVKAPDIGWRGISVASLIKDDKGNVWAVTASNILEAKADGKKGGSYIDTKESADKSTYENAKDGFKKQTFPREGINGAAFVGGKLVISTDKGLMTIKETKKTLVSGKFVEAKE